MTEQQIPTVGIDHIKRLIPHRYPFLLVDRVQNVEANKSAVGIKCVTMNEPHFQGHFPATPIMPGVTIIEALAQTAAVMVAVSNGMEDKDLLVYFMSVDSCKFRRKVIPGDVLELKIETLRGKPGAKVWKFSGVATVEGEVACQCEFAAMIDLPAE